MDSRLYIDRDKNNNKITTGTPIVDYSLDSIRMSNLVNTVYFSEAAKQYEYNLKRYGVGTYTRASVDSYEFQEYWDTQYLRCAKGYKVGDMSITGRQYFYLNFFRMMRSPSKSEKERNQVAGQQTKIEAFPSFWAIQWLWFTFTHISRYGGSFLGVDAGEGGLDICALKTRGAGFSFMDAADDVYNYNFIDDSKSYVLAASSMYLEGVDGIMPKIQVALNFLNTGTKGVQPDGSLSAGKWARNRINAGDEPMIFNAGFKDIGSNDIMGKRALIGAIICDNPNKARGARGMKITLEEGGSFPNLITVDATTQALVKDGSIKTGSRSLFGTGGESGPGIEGIEAIFNNPRAFGYMAFPNIWEGEMDEIGFFCPSYLADAGNIDLNGNADVDRHIRNENKIREGKKNLGGQVYDKHVAEYPRIPSEALKRLTGNVFNVAEIQKRIRKIESRPSTRNPLRHGDLVRNLETVEFRPNPNAKPILQFPHTRTGKADDISLEGCVTVLQAPYIDKGKVPEDMYFIVVDNYGVDGADNVTSLFSAYVYMYPNAYDNEYERLPVAWYNARPEDQEATCYPILYNLSTFYGDAKIMSERNPSGNQIIAYFKRNHLIHLLMDELTVDSANGVEKKRKLKFMTVSKESNLVNVGLLSEFIMKTRYEITEDDDVDSSLIGNVRNLDMIEDLGLLREMEKFNLNKGNFDRISANQMAPIIIKQKLMKGIEKLREKSTLSILSNLLDTENREFNTYELVSEY